MALSRLPDDLAEALAAAQELAVELKAPTYLIGGAVRDSLLGHPIADVDLAVDGDAPALAAALAERLGASLLEHIAFGTATVTLGSGRRLDLATLRRESYRRPAALPEVEPGTLNEDLHRRDFTVNSFALPIGDLDNAALIAPSGGLADLDARRLRVHHDRSFVDDPTRILRGVRFEARLGFRFDSHTEELARAACADGLLLQLSPNRLRGEVDLLLAESEAAASAWQRLGELGALASIGFSGDAGHLIERVVAPTSALRFPEGIEPPTGEEVLLLAVLGPESPDARGEIAKRLVIARRPLAEIAAVDSVLDELGATELAPHRLAEALAGLSAAGLALVQSVGDDAVRERVDAYLDQLGDLRLGIDGEMLVERGFEPGPQIGRALRETLNARLDGRIEADEELDFALGLLGERRDG